jgi:MoaA/NifB/PqqE/SkfB family radical SAM enzyme
VGLLRRAKGVFLQATGRLRPEVVVFEITHRCNSQCSGCGYRDAEPHELSAARWIELAEEARALGFAEVLLTGGEPLVHPEIEVLLDGVSAHLPVALNTNGRLLERHADVVRRAVASVYVSLDGASEATWRQVRGVGGMEKVCAGVRRVSSSARTHARVCLWEANCEELDAILARAEGAGFHALSFMAPDTTSGAFGDRGALTMSPPRPDQLASLAADLRRLAHHPMVDQSEASIERVIALVEGRARAPRCLAPWTSGVVGPEGGWSPCFFLDRSGDTGAGLGAVMRESTAARRRIRVAEDPVCRQCVCWRG